jgi:hypothetical protein
VRYGLHSLDRCEGAWRNNRHFGPRSRANDSGRHRCAAIPKTSHGRETFFCSLPCWRRLGAPRPDGGSGRSCLFRGISPVLLNDDGTMARVPDLVRFCKMHELKMITLADLARYRLGCDYEGLLGAIERLFPVSLANSATAFGRVTRGCAVALKCGGQK